jgi:hypothetical protein
VFLSAGVTTLATLCLWGAAGTGIAGLVGFVLLYGVGAGGWSSIWVGMVRAVQREGSAEQREADGGEKEEDGVMGMGVLMGLFSAGRGVGAVVSGPLSEVLIRGWGEGRGEGGFGTRFGGMVLFTGGTAALAGVVCLGLRAGAGGGRRWWC